MSTKKRLLKNFLSLSGAEFVSRLLSVFLFIFIANLFGANAFGQLAFATSLTAFFNIFADFGLTMIGIREISREKDQLNPYGNNILVFQLGLVAILTVVLALLLLLMPISMPLKILTFIFGLRIVPAALDVSYIFQAFERMEYVLITRILTQVIYLGLGLLLLFMYKNIIGIPIALVAGTLVSAVVGYILLRIKFGFIIHPSYFNVNTIKRFTFMSFSVFSAAILAGIYNNLDAIMLQLYANTTQVGYYSAGYKIVNTIMVFTVFIGSTFFPMLSGHFLEEASKFKQTSISFAKSMGFVTLPIVVGGFVYAKSFILLIYRKQEFIHSIAPFQILLFLILLSSLITLFGTILVAANYQKYNLYSVIVGVVVNVSLNFILIPRFGVIGASFAIVFSQLSALLYLIGFHLVRMDGTIDILREMLLKPVIASLLMLIVILPTQSLLIGILLGGLVYICSMYVMKGLPINDIPFLQNIPFLKR